MSQKSIVIATLLSACVFVVTQYRLPVVIASTPVQNEAKTPVEPGKGGAGGQQPMNVTRAAREEKALQDARRQQLAEKEAALAAKELELKKLSAKIEAQVKALEESKKRIDDSMKAKAAAQKKASDEKLLKMVKLFKTLKGEQAGKFIDSLQENKALALLSHMDTKAVAKLAPFISQPRILKWITDNLNENTN